MIIIKIQGGLGNQLMQYSLGRLLESLYNKEISYDLSFFSSNNKYTKRPYLLDKFVFNVRSATQNEIETIKYPLGFFSKVINVLKRILNKFIIKSYNIGYDKNFIKKVQKNENLYLEGFWQSYSYYEPILELLRKEIILKEEFSCNILSCIKEINFKNSVAVHIRRGDYLTSGSGLKTLDIDYYKKAVTEIENRLNDPHYYIFSDDSVWVKDSMSSLFKNYTFVDQYMLTDYEEFILMTKYKNAIIANSTFSWFASLLNINLDKNIVSPLDWKNVHLMKSSKKICPPSWISV